MKSDFSIHEYLPKVLDQYIERFSVYCFSQDVDVQLFPKIIFQSHCHFQHNTSYNTGWKTRPKNFVNESTPYVIKLELELKDRAKLLWEAF